MTYVYIQSEPRLYTVGFYDPDGKWHSESDHDSREQAASRVHYLNGGADWRIARERYIDGQADPGPFPPLTSGECYNDRRTPTGRRQSSDRRTNDPDRRAWANRFGRRSGTERRDRREQIKCRCGEAYGTRQPGADLCAYCLGYAAVRSRALDLDQRKEMWRRAAADADQLDRAQRAQQAAADLEQRNGPHGDESATDPRD